MSLADTSPFTLLRKQSLPSLVQQEIENMILEGQLSPGAKLSEMHLAQHFGISRGPIREAFRGLEEKALVRVEKNRGVYVREISLEEADQIYEVRLALEGRMGYLAAKRRTPEQAGELQRTLAAVNEAASTGDNDAYHTANLALHELIALCAANPKLAETYQRLANELALYRRWAHRGGGWSMKEASEEHNRIVFAILEGDAEGARNHLEAHVEAGRLRLHEAILHERTG
jgi:DNA-binding GntR family transcriptional regulator